jgi:para-aminobenzoate synthetase / 4-amino-4-deoxychorismate lyase
MTQSVLGLSAPPLALVGDPAGDGWLAFDQAREILRADQLAQVPGVLAAAEGATTAGYWAVGFCAYEAAGAFDPALATHPPSDLPLAWFALCEPPQAVPADGLPAATPFLVADLRASLTPEEHAAGVSRVQGWIARGDTYQVNYTHRLRGRFEGDPWGLFRALERGQPSRHAAWIDIGSHVVCSASPELFFELAGDRLTSRPMKGTAPRGRTTGEDRLQAAALAASAKDRAENVMIVDMLRNDLGRVARAGTVETSRLFAVERYHTVFQMTSTVAARTDRSVCSIFAALFPCASITGAPKVRAMQLITRLEAHPRGLYTGAIGWLAPERRATFSVAIRTAVISRADGAVSYGTGGGIVWDSDPAAELAECRHKTRILTDSRPVFELLETLAWRPAGGYRLLDRHLERLLDSAAYFGFALSRRQALTLLESATSRWNEPRRVRLTVSRNGALDLSSMPLTPVPEPVRLALAAGPVDSSDPFLFHKTTHRAVYARARAERPGADDVLLWNERGELTESTIANLVVELDGGLVTPPLTCGLLAGSERAELLARGEIDERVLRTGDLRRCRAIYLVNSVRGRLRADLVAPPEIV